MSQQEDLFQLRKAALRQAHNILSLIETAADDRLDALQRAGPSAGRTQDRGEGAERAGPHAVAMDVDAGGSGAGVGRREGADVDGLSSIHGGRSGTVPTFPPPMPIREPEVHAAVSLPPHAPALVGQAMQMRELYLKRATTRRHLQQLISRSVSYSDRSAPVHGVLQPAMAQPGRRRGHQDVLCEEMVWAATDVYQERRWKIAVAKVLAEEAAAYVQARVGPAGDEQHNVAAAEGAGVAAMREAKERTKVAAEGAAAHSARQRSLAIELALAKAMAPGDAAALAGIKQAGDGIEHKPTPGEGEDSVTARLRSDPFAAVQGDAVRALSPVWKLLRRAVFSLTALGSLGSSAVGSFNLCSDIGRSHLLAFRPPGLIPVGGSGQEVPPEASLVLTSRSLGVLSVALAGAAECWVEDGLSCLGRKALPSTPPENEEEGEEDEEQQHGGSAGAVLDAVLRGTVRLRRTQAHVATRILASWLAGAPAVLEGWVTTRGLGRCTIVAAAIGAAHARGRAQEAGQKARVSLIVCSALSAVRWAHALTKFCTQAAAVVSNQLESQMKQARPNSDLIIVYPIVDVSSATRLHADLVLCAGPLQQHVTFTSCVVDQRGFRASANLPAAGSTSSACPALCPVQGVMRCMAEGCAAAVPQVSGRQATAAAFRLLITTAMQELPGSDAAYLVDVARFLLPLEYKTRSSPSVSSLSHYSTAEGRQAVERLCILSMRATEAAEAAQSVAQAAVPGGEKDGAEKSPPSSGMDVDRSDNSTSEAKPSGVVHVPMTAAEIDAAVVSGVNKVVWPLYIPVDTGMSENGANGGSGTPGGSPSGHPSSSHVAHAGRAVAVPANTLVGTGVYGGPDRLERPVQIIATPLQSVAQTRTLRLAQARSVYACDLPSLSLTTWLGEEFRIRLAKVSPPVGRGVEEQPAVAMPGLIVGSAGDGVGVPPLPSQTSAQALRTLSAFHAASQHAHLWAGMPADARPDAAAIGCRLQGSWYGAVNSLLPRVVVHPLETCLSGRVLSRVSACCPPIISHETTERGGMSRVAEWTRVNVDTATRLQTVSCDALLSAICDGDAEALYDAWCAGVSAGRTVVVLNCCVDAHTAGADHKRGVLSNGQLHLVHRHQRVYAGAEAGWGSGRAGGKRFKVSKVAPGTVRAVEKIPGINPFTLSQPVAVGPRMLGLAIRISALQAATSGWDFMRVVGPHPVAEGRLDLECTRARVAQAVEPAGSGARGLAHRMLLRSGKLRALSAILSECSAFGHVPLLLSHTGETAAMVQAYLDACGTPLLRLDSPAALNDSSAGLWPTAGPEMLSSLCGKRQGLVVLACCAPPSWLLKLENPRAVSAGVDAVLGPCSSIDASTFDAAVVLDYALGMQSGLVLEGLLDKLRYARALPVLRLRSNGQMEELLHTSFLAAVAQGLPDLPGDGAVIPRVLQPHASLTEAEIEEQADTLILSEAKVRMAGVPGAEQELARAVALRTLEAVTRRLALPPLSSPRDRHLRSPVGQAMARRFAARQSSSEPTGTSVRMPQCWYDVPGPAGGDVAEDEAAETDALEFGYIDANTGRHIIAPALRPPPLKHRRIQRRLPATMRGVVDVLARHQDGGGLHLSHAYGPPAYLDKRVSAPPAALGDRASMETSRFNARVTMDVLPANDYAKQPTAPPPSSITAPAPPMPWRMAPAVRRGLQVHTLALTQAAQRGAGAGGPAGTAPMPPPSTVPGVSAALRQSQWTRLSTRANATGETPFVHTALGYSGEPAANLVAYAGPAPVITYHDPFRRLQPMSLHDDMRIVTQVMECRERASSGGGTGAQGSKAISADPADDAMEPSASSTATQSLSLTMVLEPLQPEPCIHPTLATHLANNMKQLVQSIREFAGTRVTRAAMEAASTSQIARKRIHESVFGRDASSGVGPALKRAKLALGLPGEHAAAAEMIRLATRDCETDGLSPLGSLPSATPPVSSWTVAEDLALLRAVAQYGNSWGMVQEAMRGAAVNQLLPSGTAYSHVATVLNHPNTEAGRQGQARLVPTVMPLVSNRLRSGRSLRGLYSRYRAWVHRPVHISASFLIPGPAASASGVGVGSAATGSKGVGGEPAPRVGLPVTTTVRILPAATGGLKERASLDVVPLYTPRKVGGEEMLGMHIRTSVGVGAGARSAKQGSSAPGSSSNAPADRLPGGLMLGSGQPLQQGVRGLSAAEAVLDAPARRKPLQYLSDALRLSSEAAAGSAPPDLLSRDTGPPNPQQRLFVARLADAVALDPEVAAAAAQPGSAAASEAMRGAPAAGMMRAPIPLAASVPQANAVTAAAAAAGLPYRPADGYTLTSLAFKHSRPGTVAPPFPPGPPPALFNLQYLPRADPYRPKGEWMLHARAHAEQALKTTQAHADAHAQGQRSSTPAPAIGTGTGAGGTGSAAGGVKVAAGRAVGRGEGGRGSGGQAERQSAIDAEFLRIAREKLVRMCHVVGKTEDEFLPWLTSTLSEADRSRIVAAYSNHSLSPQEQVSEVTSIMAERIQQQQGS